MQIEKIYAAECGAGKINMYRMTNSSGAYVTLCNVGAGVAAIAVPDRRGRVEDVVLGYKNPEDYIGDGPCMGKTPGRFANRIARGHLVVDGVEYQLGVNNGPNHLHGGVSGFANRLWCGNIAGDKVVFTLHSDDGDEVYPAALDAKVAYSWSDDCVLNIELSAVSDGTTVVNLTNHSYFNLAGEGSGSVLSQRLQLDARCWLPTDQTLIPTGEIASVASTPMDFTQAKALGQDIKADFDALHFGKGYDNCWVVDNWVPGRICSVAELYDEGSGRVLKITSDQPAVQVYTGNWLAGSAVGKCGRVYEDYEGVAIECQAMPDAPNKSNFPSAVLHRGEEYRRRITFSFSTR